MVTFTHGYATSFDMTQNSGVLHPVFAIRSKRRATLDLFETDDPSFSEVISYATGRAALGFVIVENTANAEIVATKADGRPSEGGVLLVTPRYVSLIYLDTYGFEVYVSADTSMNCELARLLPTRVISSPSARFAGLLPSAYSFVAGGLVEVFETADCVRLPNCSYAFTVNGRLKGAFGIKVGSATADFKPTTSFGALMSALSSYRRNVASAEYLSDQGVVVADAASVSEALDKFCEGRALDVSAFKLWSKPISLAYTLETRLAALQCNYRGAEDEHDWLISLSFGAAEDGVGVRQFCNGDASAFPFVAADISFLASITNETNAIYNQSLSRSMMAIRESANTAISSVNNEINEVSGYRSALALGNFDLSNIPVPDMPLMELIGDVTELSTLTEDLTRIMTPYSGCFEVIPRDENNPTERFGAKPDVIVNQFFGNNARDRLKAVMAGSDSVPAPTSDNYFSRAAAAIEDKIYHDLGKVIVRRSQDKSGFSVLNGEYKDGVLPMVDKITDMSLGESFEFKTDDLRQDDGSFIFTEANSTHNQHECVCGHTYHCDDSAVVLSPEMRMGGYPKSDDSYEPSFAVPANIGDLLKELPYVDSNNKYHGTGYRPKSLSTILGIKCSNVTTEGSFNAGQGSLTFDAVVTLAFRPFDLYHGAKTQFDMAEMSKQLLKSLLKQDLQSNDAIEFVRFEESIHDKDKLKSVKYRTGHNLLPGFAVQRSSQPDGYKSSEWFKNYHCDDENIQREFPYSRCYYCVFDITLRRRVTEKFRFPVFNVGGINVKPVVEQMAADARTAAADAAAAYLVRKLDGQGMLGSVQFVFDLDGNKHYIAVQDSRKLSSMFISKTAAVSQIEILLKARDVKVIRAGDVKGYALTDTQRSQINENIVALAAAAGYNYSGVGDVEGKDASELRKLIDDSLTDGYKGDAQPFWYIKSLDGAGYIGTDPALIPYYGAIV